ncbi:hypothetical protein N7540_002114 [Penicillium herquei]|nr:hypothetical protein N7540_002114 [Penicillium herquei]
MDPGGRNSSRPYHSRFEPRVPVPRRVEDSQDNRYPLIDPRSKVNAGALDQTSTKSSRLDAIFRSFGLGIIYDKLKRDEKEHPKVAIWDSRMVALPRLLFHIIPVGGAIVLLWLNLMGYYLGTEIPGIEGHNSAKIGALQFAAKMHEITILASLSIIVFNLIQDRIVTHDVALSVLFAGLQFRDLSYIWSKELWQLVGSERRRWKSFIPVLLLAVLLASTAAPSSALLMVPRSDEYAAGGTEFWLNATRDELWPSEVTLEGIGVDPSCLKDPDPLYCPSSGWDSFASQALPFFRNTALPGSPYNFISNPDSAPIPGKYGSRDLKLRVGVRGELGIGWTIAACPTRVLADALVVTSMFWDYASFCPPEREHFSWRESATWAISGLRQATTTVSCFASQDGKIRVPLVEPSEGAAITYPSEIMNVTDIFWAQQVSKMSRSPRPELLWLKLNHTKLGAHSLGAIATIPNKNESDNIVIGCELDPRWVDSTYDIKHSQIPDIRLTTWIAEPEDYSNVNVYHAIPPRIKISPDWAEYLNPVISSMNQTAFENMMIMTGQWKSGIFYHETERIRESVETIIAGMEGDQPTLAVYQNGINL